MLFRGLNPGNTAGLLLVVEENDGGVARRGAAALSWAMASRKEPEADPSMRLPTRKSGSLPVSLSPSAAGEQFVGIGRSPETCRRTTGASGADELAHLRRIWCYRGGIDFKGVRAAVRQSCSSTLPRAMRSRRERSGSSGKPSPAQCKQNMNFALQHAPAGRQPSSRTRRRREQDRAEVPYGTFLRSRSASGRPG